MLSERKLMSGNKPSSDHHRKIINNSIPAHAIDKILKKAAKDVALL